MHPTEQIFLGIVLIILAGVVAIIQATQHVDAYSIVVILLGAIGGQQIGQGLMRRKR